MNGMVREPAMQHDKPGWDKRAWLVSLIGGTVSANISAWLGYPPVSRHLNKVTHHNLFGSQSSQPVEMVCGVISLLLLPGIISGIARRWTFLWGLLPLTLFVLATDAEDWAEKGLRDVVHDFWITLALVTVCLVISSGPVSLFRYLRVQARRKQEAAWAAHQAQREAASVPQEGAWPPPPDYGA